MKTDNATPRPWQLSNYLEREDYPFERLVTDGKGSKIASKVSKQDAELIVRAVNAHDALVEILKQSLMCIDSLGSQLEKYHTPAWQYHQTIAHIKAVIDRSEGMRS